MDPSETFRRNDWSTLGVEVELQLVDQRSMALRSAIADVLAALAGEFQESVKPEFLQCYVEVNSGVCRTVSEVGADLSTKVGAVESAADRCGVDLLWAATHPFSHWRDQEITPNTRYYKLAKLMGETVVRPVTFGLHVHVGVDSGDKAVKVGDLLQEHLPLILALSANSPFWGGRATGDHAHRVSLLEGFPTGGLPPRLQSWDDYLTLFQQLKQAGFIESQKELWWDVRPSPEFGTVEVRICDMPPDLPSVLGLTSLIQCLVADLSQRIDRGEEVREHRPLLVRQNRWRACRFGLDSELVDPITLEAVPARKTADQLARRLLPIAERLGCVEQLERIRDMAAGPTGSESQLAIYEETRDLPEVVRRMVSRSRINRYPVLHHGLERRGDEASVKSSPFRYAAHAAVHTS